MIFLDISLGAVGCSEMEPGLKGKVTWIIKISYAVVLSGYSPCKSRVVKQLLHFSIYLQQCFFINTQKMTPECRVAGNIIFVCVLDYKMSV